MSALRHIGVQVGLLVFVLDQISKYVIVQAMDLKTRLSIDVLPPFVNFRMAWNEGINFGILSDMGPEMRWFWVFLSLLISGWVIWWIRREGGGRMVMISAGLLVGGALGNVIDRIIYGAVADFLNMSCCGIENPFSFNVADISIFAGAFGLILFSGKTPETP
ncbi:MAG: signal peptidase II [Pseudomonadota bacterium]